MSIKKMKKEDLELMSYKDITYLLLEEKGVMNTKDLFTEIVNMLDLPKSVLENKIADYYMMLTTDKRFILLDDGKWDLKNRHTSDKVSTDIEEDEEEELEEESNDNKESTSEEDEDEYELDSFDDDNSDNEDLKDLIVIDEEELELEE